MTINYDKIRNLVECEIDKISQKDQLTENSLAILDKLVDIRKDLDTLEMNDGIAEYYEDWNDGNSYRGGNSYRRGYARGNSYARGRSYRGGRGYSYHNGDDAIDHLHMALESAQSDSERDAIRKLIDKMDAM